MDNEKKKWLPEVAKSKETLKVNTILCMIADRIVMRHVDRSNLKKLRHVDRSGLKNSSNWNEHNEKNA